MSDSIQLWALLAVPESLILALTVWGLGRLLFPHRSASRCKLFTLALVAIVVAPALTIILDQVAVTAPVVTVAPEAATTTVVAESAITNMTHVVTSGASPTARIDRLLPILGMIWIVGMAIGGLRLVCAVRNLRHLMRAGRACEDEAILRSAAAVAKRLGLARVPQILIVNQPVSPFVTGIVRPTIVLPAVLCAALEPVELEDVLTHEAAHIFRRDLAVGFLQRALATVFWFCPWLHLLNHALNRAREEVCDNFVLAARDAADYANTLLRVGEVMVQRPPVVSAAMAASKSSLRGRVEALLCSDGKHETKGATLAVFGPLAVLLVGAMMVVLPLVSSAAEAVSPKPEAAPDAPAVQVMVEATFIELNGSEQGWQKLLPKENVATPILSKDAAGAFQKKLAELGGTDILSAPRVTTLSGRTATITLAEQRDFAELENPVELGVSFEVTPTVGEADTIALQMKPKVVTFLGYADGMPIISTRTVDANVKLRNGETVVLGGMTTESEARVLLVIVSASVMKPDGVAE